MFASGGYYFCYLFCKNGSDKSTGFTLKRNIERFPGDFMFQLTKDEWENLIFHFGMSSKQPSGRRFMPYVFTEQGRHIWVTLPALALAAL
ncbi:MAG: ORF6N domain-containing protein [Treponema sp.]|nr:ORF6N domain-containing protein [Treponema sp.]